MNDLGNLKFNSTQFNVEETHIYGILEGSNTMTWDVGIFPPGEENYIMLNSFSLHKQIFNPKLLSAYKIFANNKMDDLYGHTVYVDGNERFLENINVEFGDWDSEGQKISIIGKGLIMNEEELNLPEVEFTFETDLVFKGLNIFETTITETEKFIQDKLKMSKNELEIIYEDVPSGFRALINGPF